MSKGRIVLLSDNTIRKSPNTSRYLGPYVVADSLENDGFEVVVIDYFTYLDDINYITDFLSKDTIMVGISNTFLCPPQSGAGDGGPLLRSEITEFSFSGYLWHNTPEELKEWTANVKKMMSNKCPNASLILGGSKSGFLFKSKDTAKHYEDFDYIFVGKSDQSIVEIANKLVDDKYQMDKNVYQLDKFVFNHYDRVCPTLKLSNKHAIANGEALSIEVSRGCSFNCKFCYFDKRGSTKKDIDILRDEFIYNFENFGTRFYSFTDDCFNDSRHKVETLCDMFANLPFDIEWVSYARPDLAVKFPETFDIMADTGCKGVSWGIESFNWEAAKLAGKAVNPEKVKERLLSIYDKHHKTCYFQGTLISGLPMETTESLYDTIDWICNNKILDFVSMGVLILSEFDPSLDGNFMDFADFTKNPEKYNFKKITFNPYNWEHSTMNRQEAIEGAKYAASKFHQHGYRTHLSSIWFYPQLRHLGFTDYEINDMARNPNNQEYWKKRLKVDELKFVSDYHTRLKKIWKE